MRTLLENDDSLSAKSTIFFQITCVIAHSEGVMGNDNAYFAILGIILV